MTIRLTLTQAQALRALTDNWQTPSQLGHYEVTLDALHRAGYAERIAGNPSVYKKGCKEL